MDFSLITLKVEKNCLYSKFRVSKNAKIAVFATFGNHVKSDWQKNLEISTLWYRGLFLPNVNSMPAKDWIDPQMVKTEQQIQLRQQTVKRANKSVTTMRPNPSAKQRTAALQGCGYLVSSQSVHIWGNFSQSGIHSSSKNFSPAIFWKSE